MKEKEKVLNDMINHNLFGEPTGEIIDENLEAAAVGFMLLKKSELKIDQEDKVRTILESENPYNTNYLEPYNL